MPSEPDKVAAHELVLWVENDGDLYRQQYEPILRNLMTKRARGVYDHDKAVKLFGYLTENGARRYDTGESGTFVTDERGYHFKQNPISPAFNAATRKLAATELTDAFEAEANTGSYDSLLPKKYRKLKEVAGEWEHHADAMPGEILEELVIGNTDGVAAVVEDESDAAHPFRVMFPPNRELAKRFSSVRSAKKAALDDLGYKLVHVNAYGRRRNGRSESVSEHERRQLVRGDTSPSMEALRRRGP